MIIISHPILGDPFINIIILKNLKEYQRIGYNRAFVSTKIPDVTFLRQGDWKYHVIFDLWDNCQPKEAKIELKKAFPDLDVDQLSDNEANRRFRCYVIASLQTYYKDVIQKK